jgi:hypothetical protein
MSADMRPIVEVQPSSAQVRSIGATGLDDGDGDDTDNDEEIEIETGIQWKRIRERDKKSKTEIALKCHGTDFEKVPLPEVPGNIGRSWCDESSVAW